MSLSLQKQSSSATLKSGESIRKKIKKKIFRVCAVIATIFIACGVLIYIFPFYRIMHLIGVADCYSTEQIAKAFYIGTAADRIEAQAVLRFADKAFQDVSSTSEENKEEYGLLYRYATPTDYYGDVAFNEYTLDLWSAHLGEDEGWIWVFYSSEACYHNGSPACGSWRIPSLWKVEKNDFGQWIVADIIEHP